MFIVQGGELFFGGILFLVFSVFLFGFVGLGFLCGIGIAIALAGAVLGAIGYWIIFFCKKIIKLFRKLFLRH